MTSRPANSGVTMHINYQNTKRGDTENVDKNVTNVPTMQLRQVLPDVIVLLCLMLHFILKERD